MHRTANSDNNNNSNNNINSNNNNNNNNHNNCKSTTKTEASTTIKQLQEICPPFLKNTLPPVQCSVATKFNCGLVEKEKKELVKEKVKIIHPAWSDDLIWLMEVRSTVRAASMFDQKDIYSRCVYGQKPVFSEVKVNKQSFLRYGGIEEGMLGWRSYLVIIPYVIIIP